MIKDSKYIPTKDYIIFRTPEIFEDKTRFKGHDGMTIAMNVFHEPEKHIRCYGEVLFTPRRLTGYPLLGCSDVIGKPGYETKGQEAFRKSIKRRSDIVPNVLPGDIIYFHYNTMLPPQNKETLYNHHWICDKAYIENGERVNYHIYRVPYDQVFMLSRFTKTDPSMEDHYINMMLTRVMPEAKEGPEGTLLKSLDGKNMYRRKYHAVGGWALVRPDYETWEDILIPIPQTGHDGKPLIDQVTGEPIMLPKEKWLAKKSAPGKKHLQGWVEVVGEPLKGDDCNVKKGDHVFVRPNTDTPLVVDGVNYYRVMQRNINVVTDKPYKEISEEDRKPINISLV